MSLHKKTDTNTVTFLVCANTVHRRPLVIISLQTLSLDTRKQEVEKRKLKSSTLIGQYTKTQASTILQNLFTRIQ